MKNLINRPVFVILILTISVLTGCYAGGGETSSSGGNADVIAGITNLAASADDGKVILTWTDPDENYLDHVEITWTPDGSTEQTADKGAQTFVATGLANNTTYTFTVKAVDEYGNRSLGVKTTATPNIEVLNLSSTPGNGGVVLKWDDPAYNSLDHIEITWENGGSSALSVAKGTETCTIPGLTNGILYKFTIKTSNNSGNLSEGIMTSATPCHQEFVYVSDINGTILTYIINPDTGVLTEINGSSFTSSKLELTLTMHPSGQFLYGKNYKCLLVYSIDPVSGALTETSRNQFDTSIFGSAIIYPGGKFLYSSNSYTNNISVYSINTTTGALTEISGSPFTTGTYPLKPSIDLAGRYLYVSNFISYSISAYTINSNTGALTEIEGSPFAVEGQPIGTIVDTTGKFLYGVNGSQNKISAYSISSDTGYLTGITCNTLSGLMSTSQIMYPAGNFLYIIMPSIICAYLVNQETGVLTAITGSPFKTGADPSNLVFDSTGNFLYVTNKNSNNISAYTINSTTGVLTEISGSPFNAGSSPISIVTVKK